MPVSPSTRRLLKPTAPAVHKRVTNDVEYAFVGKQVYEPEREGQMSAESIDDGLVAALLDSICDKLRIPRGQLDADGTLETLAIDSLTFIQVIIDMERRLKRPIAPETLDKITMEMTVRDVAALLAKA